MAFGPHGTNRPAPVWLGLNTVHAWNGWDDFGFCVLSLKTLARFLFRLLRNGSSGSLSVKL